VSATQEFPHKPVMVSEVILSLITDRDGLYVDGTTGSGGHSEAILRELSDKGRLICLDRDPDAIKISSGRLKEQGNKIAFINANFGYLDSVLKDLGIGRVNGILLDLGMSSYQLDQSGRGFSFSRDERLDMRMDLNDATTAEDIINRFSAHDIAAILKNYGEEKRAKAISRLIEIERRKKAITTTLQLANLIRSITPPSRQPWAKDPSTRTFQALRIAVNKEVESLDRFLTIAPALLEKGGRLVLLTYHSLEDRPVKKAISDWEKTCVCPRDIPECVCGKKPLFKRINKKIIKAEMQEIENNPRARSAILRAAERI
jgi:16S rRNA (cytosine1402-N4)-methyltransferase